MRALVLCVLSGASALVYEVVWLRLLALWMGHTTGAVGTVLAAFMGGLAAGAWTAGRLAPRLSSVHALRGYAALEVAIVACALLLPFASTAVEPLLRGVYANGDGGLLFTVTRAAISLALVTIPALAMGATYPIAIHAIGVRWNGAEGNAGRVYAANTIGAVIGVFLGGFVLLPALGLRGATYVGVALNIAAAAGAGLLAASGAGGADSVSKASPAPRARPPVTPLDRPTRSSSPASSPSRWLSPASWRWCSRCSGRGSSPWCSVRRRTRSAPCCWHSSPVSRTGLPGWSARATCCS